MLSLIVEFLARYLLKLVCTFKNVVYMERVKFGKSIFLFKNFHKFFTNKYEDRYYTTNSKNYECWKKMKKLIY